ncbi:MULTISPECIES: pyridoxal-phosphate dependent enzyme [Acidobacteriaceae]|uniref:pyridoxal-phosphate dependent enzyme n=1 Tax=Acidobacteriaceae TaxID=204434 RepID=UPI0020B14204|nr:MULTISPECIES: pyridoxal-phosphate dependent enzyme [Acidobacteriaceae]MDW5267891.1 pyridoxal-phosphate dependent enzyme [Edaphobacter sp.]
MEEIKRSAKRPDGGDAEVEVRRYAAVLPEFPPVSLGEGWTPLLRSRQFSGLFVKDEGRNPTGSFEDRGMGLAVAAAKHYGVQQLSIASQGENAAALAAYATAAGIVARVFLPHDVATSNYLECAAFGAEVTLVDGLIGDCERVREEQAGASLDVSEFKEPFRLEGVKTMGYELVEQMGWEYPEAVFCPTGIGVLAIWKAFEEMEQLGWVAGRRPRIYVGSGDINSFIMSIIDGSGGRAVERGDALASLLDWAKQEGLLLSPEGAAGVGAYRALLASGELSAGDRVVLINGSAGVKHAEAMARALRLRPSLPTSLPVGGIITP